MNTWELMLIDMYIYLVSIDDGVLGYYGVV